MWAFACVSWYSRTQRGIAISPTEAEYVAMEDCVKEALLIHNVLSFSEPPTKRYSISVVREDNEGVIRLANNLLEAVPFE